MVLDKNSDTFVVYVAVLDNKALIHLLQTAKIATL